MKKKKKRFALIFEKFWAYLRLVRITNLLIIVLSQYFFRHFIILPLYGFEHTVPAMSEPIFLMLVFSTVFIAAGAYAINDYFDMRIDRINKPDKMILGRLIPRRAAILLHAVFTTLGILLSIMAAYLVGAWKLSFISIIIAFTLWMYSFKYKASFLTGNLIIAVLSSLVFFIVWLFDIYAQMQTGRAILTGGNFLKGFLMIYLSFAFLTSFIREIIKDIEDYNGDKKVGCRSLPIVWGVNTAKWVSMALTALSIVLLVVVVYMLQKFEIFKLLKYYMGLIGFMFFYLLFIIRKATEKHDFSFISNYIKVIMFAGLLSMQLIYILF